MVYPTKYTIKIYDEIDGFTKTVSGVTFSDTYTEAMSNIEDYYGDTIVCIEYMEALEEGLVYEFSETEKEG